MKFLAVFLFALVGLVSAVPVQEPQQVLDAAAFDVLSAFADGLDEIPVPEGASLGDIEDAKNALIKELQKAIDEAMKELQKRLDAGQKAVSDLVEKIDDLAKRLQKHTDDLGERLRNSFNKLKESAKKHLRAIFDRFKKIGQKPEVESVETEDFRDVIDVDLKEELIAEKVCNAFMKMVPKVRREDVGKYCKVHVAEWVKAINKWLQRGKQNTRSMDVDVSSMEEVKKAIRDFFRDIRVIFKERYAKLAEWLKKNYNKLLKDAKNRQEKMKNIAQEAIKRMGEMKKETVDELMNALRPFKAELGKLWEELQAAYKKFFEDVKQKQE